MSKFDDRVEEIVNARIQVAIRNLSICVRLDSEGDIEVSLIYEGNEIANDFIPMTEVKGSLEDIS